jgi:hypothetical protein
VTIPTIVKAVGTVRVVYSDLAAESESLAAHQAEELSSIPCAQDEPEETDGAHSHVLVPAIGSVPNSATEQEILPAATF